MPIFKCSIFSSVFTLTLFLFFLVSTFILSKNQNYLNSYLFRIACVFFTGNYTYFLQLIFFGLLKHLSDFITFDINIFYDNLFLLICFLFGLVWYCDESFEIKFTQKKQAQRDRREIFYIDKEAGMDRIEIKIESKREDGLKRSIAKLFLLY